MENFAILNKTIIVFYLLIFVEGFSKENKLLQEDPDLKPEINSECSTSSYETNQYDDESFFVSDFLKNSSRNISDESKSEEENNLHSTLSDSTQNLKDDDKDLNLYSIKLIESQSQMPFGSYINVLINLPQISSYDLFKVNLFSSNEQTCANINIDKILNFIGFKLGVYEFENIVHEKKILSILYPYFNL